MQSTDQDRFSMQLAHPGLDHILSSSLSSSNSSSSSSVSLVSPFSRSSFPSTSPPSAFVSTPTISFRASRPLIYVHNFVILFLVWTVLFPVSTRAFHFYMSTEEVRCFYDLIPPHQKVLGEYLVAAGDGDFRVSFWIKTGNGSIVFSKSNSAREKFSFVSSGSLRDQGNEWIDYDASEEKANPDVKYEFCFESHFTSRSLKKTRSLSKPSSRKIMFDYEKGASALDYSEIATEEHLEGPTLELRKLQDELDIIVQEMNAARSREDSIRQISDTIQKRVAWTSFLSCGVALLMGFYQMLYMRHFFKKRKMM